MASIRRGQGIKWMLSGAALIIVGLLMGGSIFTGNPGILDWIFDGLGLACLVYGLYLVLTPDR